jgi:hypothetical protein
MRGIPTLPWKEHMIAHKKGGTKPDVFFFWRAYQICLNIKRFYKNYRENNNLILKKIIKYKN